MKINNINNNISAQKKSKGKKPQSRGINTSDVFTPSSGKKAAFKSLPKSLSAKDAGRILMGKNSDIKTIKDIPVERTQWKASGIIADKSDFVYDVKNNCLYAGIGSTKQNQRLTAFNTDGTVRWEFKEDTLVKGPSTDKDGNIYFTGKKGLHALDKDGNSIWDLDGFEGINTNPVVSPDGTVFAMDTDKSNGEEKPRINAVKDGKVQWTYNPENFDINSNSIKAGKDGSLYITSGKDDVENFFIGLKPDGTEKFKNPISSEWNEEHRGNITEGSDGTLYTMRRGGRLSAYTPQGEEKFGIFMTGSKETYQSGVRMGNAFTITTDFPPATDSDGNVYISGKPSDSKYGGYMVCIDKDGKDKWKTELEKHLTTKPHITDKGEILAGIEDGKILVLNKKGEVQKKYRVEGTAWEDTSIENLASDDNRQFFAASKEGISAFHLDEVPFEKVVKSYDEQQAEQKNTTIQVETETVVIGGVTLKKNKKPN